MANTGKALKSVHTEFFFGVDKGGLAVVNRTSGQLVNGMTMASQRAAQLKTQVGGFLGRVATGLGVLATGAGIKSLTADFAAQADEIGRNSEALGVSAKFYTGLQFAVESVGVAGEETSQIIADVSERMHDAATGSKALADDFKQIGLTKDQLKRLSDKGPEAQIMALADAMQRAGPSSKRTFVAMSGLGDMGKRLLPLLDQGSEGLKRMMREAKALGVVLDKKAIESARKLNKRLILMKARLRGVRNAMALRLIPVVNKLVDWFVKLSKSVIAAKVALVAFLAVAAVAGVIIGAMMRTFIIAQWKAFVAIVKSAVLWIRTLNAQMLVTMVRVLAVVGAFALVALLIQDLMVFARGGDSVVERILGRDSDIVEAMEQLRATFEVIVETLSKSFEALWVSIVKLASMFGINLTTVSALLKKIGKFLFKSILLVLLAIAKVVGWIATGFAAVLSIVTDLATAVVDFLRPAVISVADAIDGMMDRLQPVFDWIGKKGTAVGRAIGAAFAAAARVAKKAWQGVGTVLDNIKKKAISLGGRFKNFALRRTATIGGFAPAPGTPGGPPLPTKPAVTVNANTTVNADGLDEAGAKRVATAAANAAVQTAVNGVARDLLPGGTVGVPSLLPAGAQ